MTNTLPEEIYVTFAGQIDNQTTSRFFACMGAAVTGGVKHVHLLIQSSGGYVGDGLALFNYLKNLPITLTTYNAGAVSSIAVIVFLAGKIRKASANATFMIHRSAHSLPAPVNADVMKSQIDCLELDDRNTEAILRANIRLPNDKWTLHAKGDLHIAAPAAKTYGLIHEIADFTVKDGANLFNI